MGGTHSLPVQDRPAAMLLRLLLVLSLSAVPSWALARTCKVEIESDDRMLFNLPEIRIAADCTQVTLVLKHVGTRSSTAMGHNWVLTRTADYRPVAIAGARASRDANYLPANDARVLAATRIIGGGETTSITFATSTLVRGGDYTFFCSFPGHWSSMKGVFVFG